MNKVVVITGISSGIGKALALEYANQNYIVCGQARNPEKIEETRSMLEKMGATHFLLSGDVGIEADCKELIHSVHARFGRIDVLICNAGISMRALFSQVPLKALAQVMQTNFWGTAYCAHYALPHLLKNNGSLIGISSVAGYIGLPGRSGYSASKHAMHGLLESIRNENRSTHFHVLIVCPGFTASNIRQTALGPQGTPQGESPRNEHKMMRAETVAKHVFKAMIHRKKILVLTPEGKLTWWLKKWIPSFVDKQVYTFMAKEKDSLFK
jgi:short-subunit dehydrogenase